jgi:hypothetical protein
MSGGSPEVLEATYDQIHHLNSGNHTIWFQIYGSFGFDFGYWNMWIDNVSIKKQ